jgi:hypothetical protein
VKLEHDTSTVVIDDRHFPAVAVICPPLEGDPDPGTDEDRMLGGHGGPGITNTVSDQVYIPCENGVFVAVEDFENQPGYVITLHSRACLQQPWDNSRIWIPYSVSIVDGRLVATSDLLSLSRAAWRWEGAEPEWTVELIDRVSRMPFTQPPGPEVRLIPLAEAFQR